MAKKRAMFGLIALLLGVWSTARFGVAPVEAARVSDIRNTKHNLSFSGPGTIKATGASDTQVCVFCHTPHAATQLATNLSGTTSWTDAQGNTVTQPVGKPLWNKRVPATTTYSAFYNSSSMDAQGYTGEPAGSSKLCLSCHDGSLAIGQVNVLNGGPATIALQNTSGGKMPDGSTGGTGFTRNLGQDLSNDHPISVTYNSTLQTNDGELRTIDGNQRVSGSNLPTGKTNAVGIRNVPAGTATRPLLPLEKTAADGSGQIQCATCHDPHIKDDANPDHNIKFLRTNRFQLTSPPSSTGFDNNKDIICLACHDKAGSTWSNSVHANSGTANIKYKTTAISQREFLTNSASRNFYVWEAACLNCHDTHTVPGARRLLREGTDSQASPKSGGNSAIEETCFQCHRPYTATENILNMSSQQVPDIWTDFGQGTAFTGLSQTYHMPIRSNEQCATKEKHDIGDPDTVIANRAKKGKDFFEVQSLLGKSNAGTCDANSNRHVECTDCHNPHRAIKNSLADASGLTTQATHRHDTAAHTNLISGALKGTYGVEPTYTGTTFGAIPTNFTPLCGSGAASDACSATVTKEYQICLKCHSNYAYDDHDNSYRDAGRPPLIASGTANKYTTPYGQANNPEWTAGDKYTNQAMEFQAPAGDRAEYPAASKANCYDTTPDTTCNHRSWHPVMDSTGRDTTVRGANANNWIAPFNAAVGSQTMYCTDCHGNATASGTVVPSAGKPWGPHGSVNPFILKGLYNKNTGTSNSDHLCFKCHSYNIYTAADGNGGTTGFKLGTRSNKSPGSDGHKVHRDKINGAGSNNTVRCNWCHVAVPHGWKNKAFLVNLNDVGPEVGLTAGTVINMGNNVGYTKGPYYRNAMLHVSRFARSGDWADADCNGGADNMKNNCKTPP